MILCKMHALILGGPDNWRKLAALVVQSFKAMEHFTVERDWQLAWLLLDVPDPRPRLARGLVHPQEQTAAVAYLREAHLLEAKLLPARRRGEQLVA